jgi:putative transposase
MYGTIALTEKKAATLAYHIRPALIEQPADTLSLGRQALLLSISRTDLYYQPSPPSAREVVIKHRLDALFTACPFYGSRKLQALLHEEFGRVARNTLRRYMHEIGIAAVYPAPNLSKRHPDHRVSP